jgi:colicin import membrane protein
LSSAQKEYKMTTQLSEEEKLANVAAGLNEDGSAKQEDKQEETPKEKTEAEKAAEAVAAEKARQKKQLDDAYAARDAEKKRADDLAAAARARELKDLEDQGKHVEAEKQRTAAAEARAAAAEARVIKLERDQVVKDSLADIQFRNARARETAFSSIVSELIQDDNKDWVHKSGASIASFVTTFVEDEDNDFLLKPKSNTGGGVDKLTPSKTAKEPKKLSEMNTDELIKHFSPKRT